MATSAMFRVSQQLHMQASKFRKELAQQKQNTIKKLSKQNENLKSQIVQLRYSKSQLGEEIYVLKNINADFSDNQRDVEAKFLSAARIDQWQDLSQITQISSCGADLGQIPQRIGTLSNLQELILYRNALVKLPESIGYLISLKILNLQSNRLKVLPSSICKLIKLQVLNIDKNQLIALPQEIGALSQLQKLDMDDNLITELPSSFYQLINLRTLDLDYLPDSHVFDCFVNKFKQLQKISQIKIYNKSSDNFVLKLKDQLENIPQRKIQIQVFKSAK